MAMTDVFSLYAWVLAAATGYAALLGFVGAHLAGRDRSLQTIATAQGGVLGIVVGLALAALVGEAHPPYGFPLATALAVAAVVYAACDWAACRWPASRSTTFVSIYAACLACGNLVAGVVPGLESHLAQIYTGDVATLSDVSARVALGLAAVFGGLFIHFRKALLDAAIDAGLYGRADDPTERRFVAVALIVLCFGVGTFGLLYTLSMLFLPTAILARLMPGGAKRHLVVAAMAPALGTFSGFALSLQFPVLPTAPAAALATIIASVVLVLASRLFDRAERFLPSHGPERTTELTDADESSLTGADAPAH